MEEEARTSDVGLGWRGMVRLAKRPTVWWLVLSGNLKVWTWQMHSRSCGTGQFELSLPVLCDVWGILTTLVASKLSF